MSRFIAAVFLWAILLFVSCTNNETGNSKDVNPEAIYFDYKVWGDEESSDVVVKLQYRFGDRQGSTVLLEHPSQVVFDGEVLTPDSSRMNGFYYEARIPLENFAGKHSIVYSDLNKKQYKEEFDFSILSLKTEIPAVINRKKLVFELDGVDSGKVVRVLLTDTSFYSRGIDKTDTIRNDTITITPGELEDLKNGPVYLEIHQEEDRPLKESTKGGGRLSLFYGLKRVFELKD